MRILLVNRMMGISWGGGENYDFNMARALQGLGHEVTVLTGQRPGPLRPVTVEGFETVAFTTPYLRQYMYSLAGRVPILPGLFAQADLHLFTGAVSRALQRILTERQIDVIQILGMPHLTEWLTRRGYPVVMRFPGPPAWFQTRQLRRIGQMENAAMFTHGDAVSHFREKLGIAVDEVPPGVDREYFSPDPGVKHRHKSREALGFGPEDLVMVSAGRLIQGKGFEFLIECLARHNHQFEPIKLVIAGDGPLRARFEKLACELGVAADVRFVGHLDKKAMGLQLRSSDAFALFSEYENYSNAALEAMASGIPVLASSVGGFRKQVREGVNGFLIELGDFGAFHSRIQSIRESEALRRRLSMGALEFAGEFSWQKCARRVEGLYAKVCEGAQ